MGYEDIIKILKEFGRTKGHVWLVKGFGRTAHKIHLKYDTTRRYFMTPIFKGYEEYHGNIAMCRVPQDVFENNVKFLLNKGFTVSF